MVSEDPFSNFTWAILGAGNGGKTAAADLSIQGAQVRLWEFPQFSSNISSLLTNPILNISGAIHGSAHLQLVSDNLSEVIQNVDSIMICCQASALVPISKLLSSFLSANVPIWLNPGNTGGAMIMYRTFEECGVNPSDIPPIVEFGTLLYGTRASGNDVQCSVLVKRVAYGVFPSIRSIEVEPIVNRFFQKSLVLVESKSALEAGLYNANPVIHPAITLLNVGAMEKEGENRLFYKDNVSPMVADMIQKVDSERLELMKALGFHGGITDAENSMLQGYAESKDYYECYANGKGFSNFKCPPSLKGHRYFEEDVGIGLVFYVLLGDLLGVRTPASLSLVLLASQLCSKDYLKLATKTPQSLGLAPGWSLSTIQSYLKSAEYLHPHL
mmetsp:Transcript_3458/g.6058  ORF Transcript_3458/g.6058 Transcript_3458/m.6058 type:complete len:385 (-) Transcript_3458:519-1673(-)|eukprot:CAMPEP_0182447822 /NCGR_PEP_ID=MMETSP1172-20130603/20732_1 /TAXON_ID=708627 /ORGANISM="Timspurckia oligopyrenoides, Strain CCMP3278" /LENGTH=384 /DNA_ID=CAMNT_0024644421 /DNA_START=137 /DNA_END=1291 /DNA_ORIENTATION=-